MTLIDPRPGLRVFLLGEGLISSAVGAGRIYPLRLPQAERQTSIVYTRISGQGDHHNTGPSGLTQLRLQIDCWAPSIAAATALANLVKERIDGFRGTMPDTNSPPLQMVVRGVFFDGEREDYDDAVSLYRVSRDYTFWFAEF